MPREHLDDVDEQLEFYEVFAETYELSYEEHDYKAYKNLRCFKPLPEEECYRAHWWGNCHALHPLSCHQAHGELDSQMPGTSLCSYTVI